MNQVFMAAVMCMGIVVARQLWQLSGGAVASVAAVSDARRWGRRKHDQ